MAKSTHREHAIVIGGSMTGMLAARVLSDHFSHVTIIERDDIPETPELRKGVPQGAHLHNLIHAGRHILERLFPGFADTMAARGAAVVDMCRTSSRYTGRGWLARMETGQYTLAQRRPLLEHVVREKVSAITGITTVSGTARALKAREPGRVTTVVIAKDQGTEYELDGDLIVDASGRGSRAPQWLEELGYEAPQEESVQSYMGYASRLIRVPEDAWPGDMRAINAMPVPGASTRGAVLFPVDDGLHMLTASGQNADFPPRDEEGFAEYLKTGMSPVIYEIFRQSEVVTEITTTRTSRSRRRRFDLLSRRPNGLIVMGDAFCAFNPIYGQGMSTGAVAADILDEELARTDDNDAVVHAFPARLVKATDYAWRMTTTIDAGYPKAEIKNLEPTEEIKKLMRYLGEVQDCATDDGVVAAAFVESQGMMTPDPIQKPEIRERVAKWLETKGEITNNDPANPPAFAVTASAV